MKPTRLLPLWAIAAAAVLAGCGGSGPTHHSSTASVKPVPGTPPVIPVEGCQGTDCQAVAQTAIAFTRAVWTKSPNTCTFMTLKYRRSFAAVDYTRAKAILGSIASCSQAADSAFTVSTQDVWPGAKPLGGVPDDLTPLTIQLRGHAAAVSFPDSAEALIFTRTSTGWKLDAEKPL